MARAGGAVCKKSRLKIFYDPKSAGGCGVAPISSGKDLFCHAVAQRAARCGGDLFLTLPRDGLGVRGVLERLARPGDGHKKARITRAGQDGLLSDDGRVFRVERIGLCRHALNGSSVGWRAGIGVGMAGGQRGKLLHHAQGVQHQLGNVYLL